MPPTIIMKSLKLKVRKTKSTKPEKGRSLIKEITLQETGKTVSCIALLAGQKQRKGDVWEDGYPIRIQMYGQPQGDRSIQFQVWRPVRKVK